MRLGLLVLFVAQITFGLEVPDGFVVERAVEPGRVEFPMFAAFDDKGRLFVTESSGLDLYADLRALNRNCRVRLLEDRDGDGRFEQSQIFADKLVVPMGSPGEMGSSTSLTRQT